MPRAPRKNARIDTFVLEALGFEGARENPFAADADFATLARRRGEIAEHRSLAAAARQRARYDVDVEHLEAAAYHDAEAERLEAELDAAGRGVRGRGVRGRRRRANPLVAPSTLAFRRWFSGSWAVDDKGQPIVVYRGEHGEDTSELVRSRMGSSVLSFTDRADLASHFATERYREGETPTPRLIPVFLRIKNPVILPEDVDQTGEEFTVSTQTMIDRVGRAAVKKVFDELRPGLMDDPEYALPPFGYLNNLAFVKAAKKKGYDGALFLGDYLLFEKGRYINFGKCMEYRPFSVEQVWPALGAAPLTEERANPAAEAERLEAELAAGRGRKNPAKADAFNEAFQRGVKAVARDPLVEDWLSENAWGETTTDSLVQGGCLVFAFGLAKADDRFSPYGLGYKNLLASQTDVSDLEDEASYEHVVALDRDTGLYWDATGARTKKDLLKDYSLDSSFKKAYGRTVIEPFNMDQPISIAADEKIEDRIAEILRPFISSQGARRNPGDWVTIEDTAYDAEYHDAEAERLEAELDAAGRGQKKRKNPPRKPTKVSQMVGAKKKLRGKIYDDASGDDIDIVFYYEAVKLDELLPTEKAAGRLPVPALVEQLKAGAWSDIRSREKLLLEPMVISVDGQIHDGHHRYAAARALGIEYAPCYVLPWETYDTLRALDYEHDLFRDILEESLPVKPPLRRRNPTRAAADEVDDWVTIEECACHSCTHERFEHAMRKR